MKDCDLVAEASAQTARENWCQRDFRYKHHCRAAEAEGLAHRAHVDLGLAAACDAVQQKGGIRAGVHMLFDLGKDG